MTIIQQSLFSLDDYSDKRPLPMIVAGKWGFPMSNTTTADGAPIFRLSDWLGGLVDAKYAKQAIRNYRRAGGLFEQYVYGIHTLREKDTRNRWRDAEYVTDEVLYRITQDLVGAQDDETGAARIESVKRYLAKAGAFADKARRDPKWAAARLEGVIARSAFTEALAQTVIDMTQQGYGTATNDVYRGVFHRDTAQLKATLNTDKVREKMSQPALHYLGIAEWACAQHIGEAESITFSEARTVIQSVAGMVGVQVGELERHFNIDIVTGKPPLPSGARS
jgi:hypothetical protein